MHNFLKKLVLKKLAVTYITFHGYSRPRELPLTFSGNHSSVFHRCPDIRDMYYCIIRSYVTPCTVFCVLYM